MSIHQMRTRELDDQDKSRRLVSCPLTDAQFCVRNRAPPDRPDHWKEKFHRGQGSALLQPMCQPVRRSPESLSAEAGAKYFEVTVDRKSTRLNSSHVSESRMPS